MLCVTTIFLHSFLHRHPGIEKIQGYKHVQKNRATEAFKNIHRHREDVLRRLVVVSGSPRRNADAQSGLYILGKQRDEVFTVVEHRDTDCRYHHAFHRVLFSSQRQFEATQRNATVCDTQSSARSYFR